VPTALFVRASSEAKRQPVRPGRNPPQIPKSLQLHTKRKEKGEWPILYAQGLECKALQARTKGHWVRGTASRASSPQPPPPPPNARSSFKRISVTNASHSGHCSALTQWNGDVFHHSLPNVYSTSRACDRADHSVSFSAWMLRTLDCRSKHGVGPKPPACFSH
jgi:hypothetical protein